MWCGPGHLQFQMPLYQLNFLLDLKFITLLASLKSNIQETRQWAYIVEWKQDHKPMTSSISMVILDNVKFQCY